MPTSTQCIIRSCSNLGAFPRANRPSLKTTEESNTNICRKTKPLSLRLSSWLSQLGCVAQERRCLFGGWPSASAASPSGSASAPLLPRLLCSSAASGCCGLAASAGDGKTTGRVRVSTELIRASVWPAGVDTEVISTCSCRSSSNADGMAAAAPAACRCELVIA
jgi:hypothetical protein